MPIKTLWDATAKFHDTFRPDDRPLTSQGAMRKLKEEVDELDLALVAHRWGHVDTDLSRAIEESIDVLVTLIGVWISIDVTWEEVEQGIRHVMAKNAQKTHETHEYRADTDTIERIGR